MLAVMRAIALSAFLLMCCGGSSVQVEEPPQSQPSNQTTDTAASAESPEAASRPAKAAPPCVRPSLEIDDAAECGGGDCLELTNLPALSADSNRVATVTDVPIIIYSSGTVYEDTKRFDLIDAASSEVTKSVELVTAQEIERDRYGVLEDCCDYTSDEPCDDSLCPPDEVLVEQNNAAMRARLEERANEVSRLLEGTFCAMTPIPVRGEEGAADAALVLVSGLSDYEAGRDPSVTVQVIDPSTDTVRREVTRELHCGAECEESVHAWVDRAGSVVLITIAGANETDRQNDVVHVVTTL